MENKYLCILINVINIWLMDTGITAVAVKNLTFENIKNEIMANILLWGIVLVGGIVVTSFQANMLSNEKILILKSCYDKNKLQKQYQAILETLDIGIITSEDSNISYINSQGVKFIKASGIKSKDENLDPMLKDIRNKIKNFETDLDEINKKNAKLQADIKNEPVFKVYKDEN